MANYDAAEQAILSAIERLAPEVSTDQSIAQMKENAAAICNLAEARAWLRSTAQPHGGSASPTD